MSGSLPPDCPRACPRICEALSVHEALRSATETVTSSAYEGTGFVRPLALASSKTAYRATQPTSSLSLEAAGVIFIDANGEGPGVRQLSRPILPSTPSQGDSWITRALAEKAFDSVDYHKHPIPLNALPPPRRRWAA